MAVTIDGAGSYKVSRVDNADTATGWSAVTISGSGGAASLLASVGTIDLVAEGTDARASRTNKQRVAIIFTNAGGYDFTTGGAGGGATKVADGIAYVWAAFLAAGIALTKVNGGLQLYLGDGTNISYWNVAGSDTYSGGLIKWGASTGIAPDSTSGTAADLGDITEIGFVTDVGGATARFDNFVVDAIDVGDGLTFQGTTTTNELFAEALLQDEATAIGVLSKTQNKIFSQGSAELSGTSLISIGESLTFADTVGGAYTYNLDITGGVDFTNTSIDASGLVDFNFDTSAATSFTMNGGGLASFKTFITGGGQTISGSVFQSGGNSTIANTISNGAFNQCGIITVTGLLDACTINKSTATEATNVDNLNKLDGSTFIKDTATSHATRLTSIGAGSMTWDVTTAGYGAGATGSPVTPTATGNEDIFVDVAGGTLTINVATGSTIPSIRSSGATVNVVAGLATVKAICQDSITKALIAGVGVILKAGDTVGGLPFEDVVTITRIADVATVSHTGHGLSTNQHVEISGSVENEYNRVKQITVTDANTYTYTVNGSPATPATGTILSTAVILFGDTDVNGEIEDSRSYSVNQDSSGAAKKGSSKPTYVSSPMSGTIDSGNGATFTILMNSDD